MEGRRKSTRKTKPTPRYIAWRGLRILTASREQASLSHTLPTDSCRVLEWVTEHSSYGLRSLLPIEDHHGDSRDETVNIDEQMVAEPDVVHSEEAFQPVTPQLGKATYVLSEVTGLFLSVMHPPSSETDFPIEEDHHEEDDRGDERDVTLEVVRSSDLDESSSSAAIDLIPDISRFQSTAVAAITS